MGGTIAGIAKDPKKDPLNYAAGQVGIEDLVEGFKLPGHTEFQFHQIANINSCDLTQDLLSELGIRVNKALIDPEIAGIVITHGTDTIEETGLFLHLCCGELALKQGKIVALTGAMLPANAPKADGPENLRLAIDVVARLTQLKFKIEGGVLGIFAGKIIAAKDFRKRSSEAIDAPVSESLELNSASVEQLCPSLTFPIPEEGNWPWVDILMSYSGVEPKILDFLIQSKVAGLVFAGTGQGNIHKNLLNSISNANKMGVPMVRATRTGAGLVRNNVGMNDDLLGTISAGALSPPQARLLLQLAIYAASHDKSLDWKKIFATIAG